MNGVSLQSLRLLAALPLKAESFRKVFDLDDVVQRRGAGNPHGGTKGPPSSDGNEAGATPLAVDGLSRIFRMKGLVIRTPKGIRDCSQDSDPDHMDPEADEVQIAWEDGTVENVNCKDLQLLNRCLFVGDTVFDEVSGSLGLVLEVQQCFDVAIPVDAFKAGPAAAGTSVSSQQQQQQQQEQQQRQEQQEQQQQQHEEQQQQQEASQASHAVDGSQLPSRLCGIRARVLGPPTLSLEPPLVQHLQQFNEGMPVVNGGRMGCVIGGKVDYVVALDSGHEFTLEKGMVGMRPEPRRGHPMSWVSGLYPSLRVYATGEWIQHFEAQVQRANSASGESQSTADTTRLSRGYVKSFAIRNLKVAWQLQGPLTASGPHQSLAPWTEHEPGELLPLQQPIMRLGQPVYVDVRRVQEAERRKKDEAGAAAAAASAAAPAGFGSACYTVGVVDSLNTSCTVLWETGSVEKDVGSHRLAPVALDRTPMDPTDCQLVPVLLPHMMVQRRKFKRSQAPVQQQEQPGKRAGQQPPEIPWWLHLHFGGLQVSGDSTIDPHLANTGKNNLGARVYKEVSIALGADDSWQGRGSYEDLLQAAASCHQRQRQQRGSSRAEETAADNPLNEDAAESNSRERGEAAGESEVRPAAGRGEAYEAARLSLPVLLRFILESDITYQMMKLPRKRMPLLRRGTSAVGTRRPIGSGGPSAGDTHQGPLEESRETSTGGPHEVVGGEEALMYQEAQALAADIFAFEGGPALEAVATFLHLVYSHGQWGGTAGATERNLQQIFEAVALVLGDGEFKAVMDSTPDKEADAELGIVVYVHRKEKKALVAWIKDTQQFATTLRQQHAEYFASAAREPYCMLPPLEQVMKSLGITPFTTGKRHSPDGPDVLSMYKEAEDRLNEDKWKAMVDLSWEPYGAISVQPQHVFFPGDLAVVRPDRLPGVGGAPCSEAPADRRVFLEIIGFCGGSLWGRTLDGVVAPFLPSDLLPLVFRRLEDLLDDSASSEDESDYSRDASDVEDDEWEDEDSGSDSTNITSLSGDSDSSRSSRDAP